MTAQIGEKLILDGVEMSMMLVPDLPEDDARIRELSDDEISESPVHPIVFSTACWRQYVGTWKIEDGKFYLVGLEGRLVLDSDAPLLAEWFSGVLRIPQGKQLHYVHMGFGSVYERELHIAIERGVVRGRRGIDNRGREHDPDRLAVENLPGGENRFRGDRDFN